MAKAATKRFPDGIKAEHCKERRPIWTAWIRASLLGALLALGLFGFLGGAPTRDIRNVAEAAAMRVNLPNPIRNGMFIETRIDIAARQPIADAVVAIPADLWREITINSLVPAATEEEYKDGEFRFHFGPLEAGERLLFKIDGQINPPRFASASGRIRLLDGTRELVAVPVSLKVIP
ncbi:MAG: hypothetical protein WKF52_05665 [Sphingomicrobium sp.]